MRIRRRQLLRQFGAAGAATAFFPAFAESAPSAADSPTRIVRLNRNESAYGPRERVKAAFQEAFTEVNRYPSEEAENLRAGVAEVHGVRPENITLGCSSTEIMRLAAETCLGLGKTLVTTSPTFDFIAHAERLVAAEVRSTPLTRHYGRDLNAMLARTEATTSLLYPLHL